MPFFELENDALSAGGLSLGDFKAEALRPFNSNDTFYVNNDTPSVFVPG